MGRVQDYTAHGRPCVPLGMPDAVLVYKLCLTCRAPSIAGVRLHAAVCVFAMAWSLVVAGTSDNVTQDSVLDTSQSEYDLGR